MNEGFVKLYRQIRDSDIYVMPPLYLRTFERMVMEANHKCIRIPFRIKGKNTDILVKRGERVTSIREICQWVGWYERGKWKVPNAKTIKNILDWLVENEMIEIKKDAKGNSQYTHYIIVNYSFYQGVDVHKVTVREQLLDTNKNEKNTLFNTSSFSKAKKAQENKGEFPLFEIWLDEIRQKTKTRESENVLHIGWLYERANYHKRVFGEKSPVTRNSIMELEEKKDRSRKEDIERALEVFFQH